MTNTLHPKFKNTQKHEKLTTLKLPLLPYLTPIGQGHEKKTILERGRNDVAPIQVYLKEQMRGTRHGATMPHTHTNGDPSVAWFDMFRKSLKYFEQGSPAINPFILILVASGAS